MSDAMELAGICAAERVRAAHFAGAEVLGWVAAGVTGEALREAIQAARLQKPGPLMARDLTPLLNVFAVPVVTVAPATPNPPSSDSRIERGIPIPTTRRGKGAGGLVDQMERGDSVVCETEGEKENLRKALRYRGIKYATRKERSGWRVWRLE